MKLLFTLLFACLLQVAWAQQIEIRKNHYYANGEKIGNYELKKVLAANPVALSNFKKAQNNRALGGFFLGFGIGFSAADLVRSLTSDINYPSGATYVGLGSMALSIPFLVNQGKKARKAVETYNEGLKNSGNTTEYTIIANANGCGIQVRF